jgi:hypothetical protein
MTPDQLKRRADKKRQYYWDRREEILAKRKQFVAANHERLLVSQSQYRVKKRTDPAKAEQAKEYFRKRYLSKRAEYSARGRERYQANRETIVAQNRAYANNPANKARLEESKKKHYEAHREEIIARAIKWRREKCQKDHIAAVENRMRNRVYHALRAHLKGTAKGSVNAVALVGCTMPELAAYLEAQFLPGMTWEDRRKWHIDHKRPCSAFDLSDPAQQRECFHYSNLQPLWASDNLSKSSHWEGKLHRKPSHVTPSIRLEDSTDV